MSKLFLSIIVGALIMAIAEKWKHDDLSAGQVMAAVRDAGLSLASVQR
jgi:hypothetical protein